MPKSFLNKIIIFRKKLASQNNSSENQNESIMVTTHFFVFFPILMGTFGKWTFINVQIRKTLIKPENVILLNFILYIFYILYIHLNLSTKYIYPDYNMKGTIKFNKTNIVLEVDIVYTPSKIEKGLMFRKRLNQDKGMLFVMPDYKTIHFWMKNTYIPLDILFIKGDTVVDIKENTTPLSLTKIKSSKPYTMAIEVNAGYCKKNNVKVGDKFHIKKV